MKSTTKDAARPIVVYLANICPNGKLATTAMHELYAQLPGSKEILRKSHLRKVKTLGEAFPTIISCTGKSGSEILRDVRTLSATMAHVPTKQVDTKTAKPKKASTAKPPTQAPLQSRNKPIELRARATELPASRSISTLLSKFTDHALPATNGLDDGDDDDSVSITLVVGVDGFVSATVTVPREIAALARVEIDVRALFYAEPSATASASLAPLPLAKLFGEIARPRYEWSALLGHSSNESPVFINTREPFCVIALGVQGSGKSHTAAAIAESCLLPFHFPAGKPLVKLPKPMAALALHFGKHDDDLCELAGLLRPSKQIESALRGVKHVTPPDVQKVVVLCSPTYFAQRSKYYASVNKTGVSITVRPLLFNWGDLTASHLRSLMRLVRVGAFPNPGTLFAQTRLTLSFIYLRRKPGRSSSILASCWTCCAGTSSKTRSQTFKTSSPRLNSCAFAVASLAVDAAATSAGVFRGGKRPERGDGNVKETRDT
jgi:hypothetical protein